MSPAGRSAPIDVPAQYAAQLVDFLAGAVQLRQDGAGSARDDLSGLGRDDATARSLEQRCAEFAFQPPDLVGRCGGRHGRFRGSPVRPLSSASGRFSHLRVSECALTPHSAGRGGGMFPRTRGADRAGWRSGRSVDPSAMAAAPGHLGIMAGNRLSACSRCITCLTPARGWSCCRFAGTKASA